MYNHLFMFTPLNVPVRKVIGLSAVVQSLNLKGVYFTIMSCPPSPLVTTVEGLRMCGALLDFAIRLQDSTWDLG